VFTLETFINNERTGNGAQQYLPSGQMGDAGHWDTGLDRPYLENGRVWVDVTVGHEELKNQDGSPVLNSRGQPKYRAIYDPQLVAERRRRDLPVTNIVDNATVLRKDQWIMIDQAVKTAARKRLRAWSDLRAANTFGGFDGMATPILEYERLDDRGEAIVDMEGISEGHSFAPTFALQGLPLPITHCDFTISQRFLATSRARGGTGADQIRGEMAGRRVAETIEQTLIGTLVGTEYGISTDYGQQSQVEGYVTHPERLTVTGASLPTGSNGTAILTEWLDHRDELYQKNFYGPFNLYVATDMDQFFDDEFKTQSDKSLRMRLNEIDGIINIRRLDYLTTSGTVLWIQMGDEIQAVNGMEITTVQWPSKGGLQLNFKVMGIQVPRIMSVTVNTGTTGPATTSATNTPILHVTV